MSLLSCTNRQGETKVGAALTVLFLFHSHGLLFTLVVAKAVLGAREQSMVQSSSALTWRSKNVLTMMLADLVLIILRAADP